MSTMDTVLSLCVEAHPRSLAVTLGDRSVSFAEVDHWVSRYVSALLGWGVRRGDIVLVYCGIGFEVIFLHHAAARIGAVFAPLDPATPAPELRRTIDYVGARFLVGDEQSQARAEAALSGKDIALGVIADDDGPTAGVNLGRMARASRVGTATEPPRPDDIHAMYFTSGSTGQPKAVMISHRANWLRAFLAANVISAGGMVCMFPLFHMAGWQVLAQSWARRRAVHLVERADAESLLGAVEHWRASTLYAIPAVWKRILECGKRFDLRSLRGVDAGTSYVGPELIVALRARFPGTHNMLGYGSTEMGAGLQIAHEDILGRPGSVGLPCPGVSAKIVDGELYLRGATMMDGYFQLPAETAAAIVAGWYRTGDLAERDGDGFHTIVGRRKEIIRSGGKTISPVELDALLKRIDGVADIAAIGLPDADWGEIVCVAVVRKPDAPLPALDQIRQQLGDVGRHKLPRALREVGFIPRTQATGQVQRNQLREMVLATPDGGPRSSPP